MASRFDAFFSDSETVKDSAMHASRRRVNELRQSQAVEMHRSSSGRNLRLKQLSVADEAQLSAAPNALTPRVPSGRRLESRQRLRSADSNSNNNGHLQRRSSFSISARVLQDLERMRSSTDPERLTELCEKPEHIGVCRDGDNDLQRREDSSDKSKKAHEDTQDETLHNNSEAHNRILPASQEEEQVETKAVASFGLWRKATKSKRLPDAIIFSRSGSDESKPSHIYSSSTSVSSRAQPTQTPSVSEMVSQLHLTHPHLAALALLDIPMAMSLTRSISPRIRRPGFSSLPDDASLRRASSVPTTNDKVTVQVKSSSILKASSSITQWKRGELIGEGTFGKVYKGLNIATGELFALKKIVIHSSSNTNQVTQMQKLGDEIELMNNLSHKHIVRYKGSYHTASHFYIFMEYVSGGSIASMLKQFDAFSEDLIRIFTRQIVQGVEYLHQMGIIHRDIKGANVLVNEQGVAKLADFGCSKQLPSMLTTSLEESLRSIRGSIPWMAPEVVKQTGHGYKADIWSIGATVIEMATRKHPWPHCQNSLSAMYTIAMATSPPSYPDNFSVQAKSFLERCFCIDPKGTVEEQNAFL
ncbi:unnamed protein product [Peronospora belbahrii]|uniref:Protein kinase domain-containing protein n=1 Tax=Peronospora belbahrii TaxID=622444 RepID=A0AAU9KIU7_9STRA|nr:unnamed protein product [Peronospora belbahrii]